MGLVMSEDLESLSEAELDAREQQILEAAGSHRLVIENIGTWAYGNPVVLLAVMIYYMKLKLFKFRYIN